MLLHQIVKIYVKKYFFDIVYEIQKDLQDFSGGKGIYNKIKYIRSFHRNSTSKSARSTLTSLSTIRVKKEKATCRHHRKYLKTGRIDQWPKTRIWQLAGLPSNMDFIIFF
jgi:hypothetical protein